MLCDPHPDAEVLRRSAHLRGRGGSQPGLGPVLAARVLAEFGDDPHRYADPKSRKNYAGTSPITKASGTRRVVLTRSRSTNACVTPLYLQAFAALTCPPPGPASTAMPTAPRRHPASQHQGLRALADRLVSILHGCLPHRTAYNEQTAWPSTPRSTGGLQPELSKIRRASRFDTSNRGMSRSWTRSARVAST